ncbi:MAG: ABC transporter ATP-binding protein [Erysipelotrichaceae bacterium]|nr:ABC transporter ATP-binding protein [Erysipelotrichaceae bacterium]
MKRIKAFLPYLRKAKAIVFLSLLCAFLATGSKLMIPFLAGKSVNAMQKALEENSWASLDLSNLFLLMGVLLLVGTIFRYLFDYLTYLLGQKIIREMRHELFVATLEQPISEIDKTTKGDTVLRFVNDIENVQTGLVSGFASLYDGVVAIIITLVFMFTLNWILGLIVVALTPLSMLVARFVSKFNAKHFRRQATNQGSLNGYSLESLRNSEAVTTLGIAKDREQGFDERNAALRDATFKANLGASIINPATRLVNAMINAAIILVGAVLLLHPSTSLSLGLAAFGIGDLSAFLTYASNYMQPFNEISDVIAEIDYALASFQRIQDIIHGPKDKNEGSIVLPGEIKDIKAKDVTFSYDASRIIIHHLNLDLKKGQKIALVGPTGCGKTTVINLLMRFYDPQEGAFYANDISTQELEKKAYRSHIGMVLQDTWIFSGTVYENIAYARPDASHEEVVNAAKQAQADGFISRLPKGYDTIISDSSGLSLGEKQLICVARVMLAKPEIVILDEATSNIDVRTEKLLSASFDQLMKGKTSLVVAHRLSTIVSSDCIVVLKDGETIEEGTHQELLAKKGFYAKLYEAQFQ